jgi:hypothetical protein
MLDVYAYNYRTSPTFFFFLFFFFLFVLRDAL